MPQIEVKSHIWVDGQHVTNAGDVVTKVVQHIINNAFQRKRNFSLDNDSTTTQTFKLKLLNSETALIEKINEAAVDIEAIKTSIAGINGKLSAINREMETILSNYVNEIDDTVNREES